MRTRLRAHRRREDELPLSIARPPQPAISSAPLQNSLHTLQRTIGNAAMRRYLQGNTGSAFISRDSAKDQVEQSAPARKVTFYMTITDDRGKQIRGPSKRKGREGQFELYSFSMSGVQAGVNGNGSKSPPHEIKHDGDTTTVINKGLVSFQFTKPLDDSSPTLLDLVTSGRHCTMHLDMIVTEVEGKESAALIADMKDVLLTNYQPAGTDSSKERVPLELVRAETVGMVTVLHTMADKAKEGGQKVTPIDPGKQP